MKTLQEIQEQVSLERFGCDLSEALHQMDLMDIVEFANDTANAYAKEVADDFKQRALGDTILIPVKGAGDVMLITKANLADIEINLT